MPADRVIRALAHDSVVQTLLRQADPRAKARWLCVQGPRARKRVPVARNYCRSPGFASQS